MNYNIYYKILTGYAIFAALSLLLINTIISSKVMDLAISDQAQKLYTHATKTSTYFSKTYYDVYDESHDYQADMDLFFAPQYVTIWIVGTQNDILFSSDPDSQPEVFPDIGEYFGDSYYTVGDFNDGTDKEWLTVYSPIVNNYQTYGYIMMNATMESMENNHTTTMNVINVVFLMMFIISMIILGIFSVCVYHPLNKLMAAAKEYAKGNYDYEIKINSHDEMRTFADTLKFMAKSFQNIYKSQKKFVENVSHDFRSPLTSIRGYVMAILDGTIPPSMQDKYLHVVLSEAERLTKLTESLLSLDTLENNGMMIDMKNFDIMTIIKDTLSSFEGQCSDKNIKIKLSHEDKNYFVHADQMRIQQVIYNLIDNAIKFSRVNSDILVELTDKNDKVFVSVKDYGVGISAENQHKVWDRFYKEDSSRGKDKRGSGLGLAIVKEIITAHHENINVISTEGVGTQFIFSIAKAKKNPA